MKILIVDDAKSVHAFIKSLFSGLQHELSHAMNGREAIDVLSKDNSINLVLLDWEMPEMDGLETLKQIKSRNNTLPVIMVTSKSSANNITTIMQNGASEYVMKPFTKDILFGKISEVMNSELS